MKLRNLILLIIIASFALSTPLYAMMSNSNEHSISSTQSSAKKTIGKWRITLNSGVKVTYTVTIYKENGKLYAFVDYGTTTDKQKLRKSGSKYYVVGDDFGLYYLVNGNQLKIGDQDGIIKEAVAKNL